MPVVHRPKKQSLPNEHTNQTDEIHILENGDFLLKYSIPSTKIIGREPLINSIKESINATSVIVLYGKHYIGKTDVACKVAQDLSNSFDFILYLNFNEELIDETISSLCHIATVLSGHSVDKEKLAYELPIIMKRNRLLFIIDNFNEGYDNLIKTILDGLSSTNFLE